jgi:hypothetical protein
MEIPIHPPSPRVDFTMPPKNTAGTYCSNNNNPYVAITTVVEQVKEVNNSGTSLRIREGYLDTRQTDEEADDKTTSRMDRDSSNLTNRIHGARECTTIKFLQNVVKVRNWDSEDLVTFVERGGRTRIRALADWYEFNIKMEDRTPNQVAEDKHPETSLARTVRVLRDRGLKHYRMKQLATEVGTFYRNFFGINMGSNKVIKAIIDQTPQIVKPPQKYTDVMPIEKVVRWLEGLGENTTLPLFQLYRKFITTLQIACITRAADIFRLQFESLRLNESKDVITFITQTKTSRGRGVYFYLFKIPHKPSLCPVTTTLVFKQRWETERKIKEPNNCTNFIHFDRNGNRLKRPDQVGKLLREIHQEAGIDTTRWGPNNARHAIITFYKAAGVEEAQIKLVTGHSIKSKVTEDFYTLPSSQWAAKSILSSITNKAQDINLKVEISESSPLPQITYPENTKEERKSKNSEKKKKKRNIRSGQNIKREIMTRSEKQLVICGQNNTDKLTQEITDHNIN